MHSSATIPLPRAHRLLLLLRPNTRRVVVIALAVLALWGWCDVRSRAVVNPHDLGAHKTDLTVYTEAGAAFFDGRNPYEVTNPRGWAYLYPPLFAILLSPLHLVAPPTQALIWFAISLLAGWGCVRECVRLAQAAMPNEPSRGWFGPIETRWGVVAVLAALFPALNCLQRGQVSVVQLYVMLLGLRLAIAHTSATRSMLAGLIMALPIAVKLTPIVPVGVAIGQQFLTAFVDPAPRRWRIASLSLAGTLAGLMLYFFFLPAACIGWRANVQHLDTWWSTIAVHSEATASEDFAGDSTSKRNQSFSNGVRRLGNWTSYQFAGGVYDDDPRKLPAGSPRPIMDAPLVDGLLLAARAASCLALLAVAYRLARTHDPLAQAVVFSLACVATLVLAPIARGHYFVFMLPAAMFVPAWISRHASHRAAIWLTIVPAVLTVGHYAAINVLGRIGLLGIGAAVWYASACWIVFRAAPLAAIEEVLLPFSQPAEVPAPIRRAA